MWVNMTNKKFISKLVRKYQRSSNTVKLNMIKAFYGLTNEEISNMIDVSLSTINLYTNRSDYWIPDKDLILDLESVIASDDFLEQIKSKYYLLDKKVQIKLIMAAWDIRNTELVDFLEPRRALATVYGWTGKNGNQPPADVVVQLEQVCEHL